MNNPVITARVRKMGRTLWSSICACSRPQRLVVQVRRQGRAIGAATSNGATAASAPRTWLAALRIDEHADYSIPARASQAG